MRLVRREWFRILMLACAALLFLVVCSGCTDRDDFTHDSYSFSTNLQAAAGHTASMVADHVQLVGQVNLRIVNYSGGTTSVHQGYRTEYDIVANEFTGKSYDKSVKLFEVVSIQAVLPKDSASDALTLQAITSAIGKSTPASLTYTGQVFTTLAPGETLQNTSHESGAPVFIVSQVS